MLYLKSLFKGLLKRNKKSNQMSDTLIRFIFLVFILFVGIMITFKVFNVKLDFLQNRFGKHLEFPYYFTPSQDAIHQTMESLTNAISDFLFYKDSKFTKSYEIFYPKEILSFFFPVKSSYADDNSDVVYLKLPFPLKYYPFYKNVVWVVVFDKDDDFSSAFQKFSEGLRYCAYYVLEYCKSHNCDVSTITCPLKFKVLNSEVVDELNKYYALITENFAFPFDGSNLELPLKNLLKSMREKYLCNDEGYDYDVIIDEFKKLLEKSDSIIKINIEDDKFLSISTLNIFYFGKMFFSLSGGGATVTEKISNLYQSFDSSLFTHMMNEFRKGDYLFLQFLRMKIFDEENPSNLDFNIKNISNFSELQEILSNEFSEELPARVSDSPLKASFASQCSITNIKGVIDDLLKVYSIEYSYDEDLKDMINEDFVLVNINVPEENFVLADNSREIVNLFGDPSYVIYFQKFPKGFENYWIDPINGLTISSSHCVAQIALDIFSFGALSDLVVKGLVAGSKKLYGLTKRVFTARDWLSKLQSSVQYFSDFFSKSKISQGKFMSFFSKKSSKLKFSKFTTEFYIDSWSDSLLKLKKYGSSISEVFDEFVEVSDDLLRKNLVDAKYAYFELKALKSLKEGDVEGFMKYHLTSLLGVAEPRVTSEVAEKLLKISDDAIKVFKETGDISAVARIIKQGNFEDEYANLVVKVLSQKSSLLDNLMESESLLLRDALKNTVLGVTLDDVLRELRFDYLERRRIKFLLYNFVDDDLSNLEEVLEILQKQKGIFLKNSDVYFRRLINKVKSIKNTYSKKLVEFNVPVKIVNDLADSIKMSDEFADFARRFFSVEGDTIKITAENYKASLIYLFLGDAFKKNNIEVSSLKLDSLIYLYYFNKNDFIGEIAKLFDSSQNSKLVYIIRKVDDFDITQAYIFNSILRKEGVRDLNKLKNFVDVLDENYKKFLNAEQSWDEFIQNLGVDVSLKSELLHLNEINIFPLQRSTENYNFLAKRLSAKRFKKLKFVNVEYFNTLTKTQLSQFRKRALKNSFVATLGYARVHYGLKLRDEIVNKLNKIELSKEMCDDLNAFADKIKSEYLKKFSFDNPDETETILKDIINTVFEDYNVPIVLDKDFILDNTKILADIVFGDENSYYYDDTLEQLMDENYDKTLSQLHSFICNAIVEFSDDEDLKKDLLAFDMLIALSYVLRPSSFSKFLSVFGKGSKLIAKGLYTAAFSAADYFSIEYFNIALPLFSIMSEVQSYLFDIANEKFTRQQKNSFLVHSLAFLDPVMSNFFYRNYDVSYPKPFIFTYNLSNPEYSYLNELTSHTPYFTLVSPCNGLLKISKSDVNCSINKNLIFDGKNTYSFDPNYENKLRKLLRSVVYFLYHIEKNKENDALLKDMRNLLQKYDSFMKYNIYQDIAYDKLYNLILNNETVASFVALYLPLNDFNAITQINCSLKLYKGDYNLEELSSNFVLNNLNDNEFKDPYFKCLNSKKEQIISYFENVESQENLGNELLMFNLIYSDLLTLFNNITITLFNTTYKNTIKLAGEALKIFLTCGCDEKDDVLKELISNIDSENLLEMGCSIYDVSQDLFAHPADSSMPYFSTFCEFLKDIREDFEQKYHLEKNNTLKIELLKPFLENSLVVMEVMNLSIDKDCRLNKIVFDKDGKIDVLEMSNYILSIYNNIRAECKNLYLTPSYSRQTISVPSRIFNHVNTTLILDSLLLDPLILLIYPNLAKILDIYQTKFTIQFVPTLSTSVESFLNITNIYFENPRYTTHFSPISIVSKYYLYTNGYYDNLKMFVIGNITYYIDKKIKKEDNKEETKYLKQVIFIDKNESNLRLKMLASEIAAFSIMNAIGFSFTSDNPQEFVKILLNRGVYDSKFKDLDSYGIVPNMINYDNSTVVFSFHHQNLQLSSLKNIPLGAFVRYFDYVYVPNSATDTSFLENLQMVCEKPNDYISENFNTTSNILYSEFEYFSGACYPSNLIEEQTHKKRIEKVFDTIQTTIFWVSWGVFVASLFFSGGMSAALMPALTFATDLSTAAVDAFSCFGYTPLVENIDKKYLWPNHPIKKDN